MLTKKQRTSEKLINIYYDSQLNKKLANLKLLQEKQAKIGYEKKSKSIEAKINRQRKKELEELQRQIKGLEPKKEVKKKKTIEKKAEYLAQLRGRIKELKHSLIGTCITCGKKLHYLKMNGGHRIEKGSHKVYKFEEWNIHCQCRQCNKYLHSNPMEYRKFMVNKYGEKQVQEREEGKNQLKKYDYEELNNIIDFYKNKIKDKGYKMNTDFLAKYRDYFKI